MSPKSSASSRSSNISSACEYQTISFSDLTLNNPDNWLWDFGDGGSSNIQNPSYDYLDSGLYTVSLSVIDDKWCESLSIINIILRKYKLPKNRNIKNYPKIKKIN